MCDWFVLLLCKIWNWFPIHLIYRVRTGGPESHGKYCSKYIIFFPHLNFKKVKSKKMAKQRMDLNIFICNSASDEKVMEKGVVKVI